MATTEPTSFQPGVQANAEQDHELSKEQRIAARRERILAKRDEKGLVRGRLEGILKFND